MKSSGSVREGVHLDDGVFSGPATNDNQRKTPCSAESGLRLSDKAEAGEEVGEEEAGGELKVGQDGRGGRLLINRRDDDEKETRPTWPTVTSLTQDSSLPSENIESQ